MMSTEFFLYVVHTKHYDMADHAGELYKFGYTKDIGSRIDGYKTGFYYKMKYKVFFFIDIPIKNFDGIEFESLIKAELKKADKKKEKDDEMYRLTLDKIIEITESKLNELKKIEKYRDFIFKKITEPLLLSEPKTFMFDKIQELIKEFDNIKNGNKINGILIALLKRDAENDKLRILKMYENDETKRRCILCNRQTGSGYEVEHSYCKYLDYKPKMIVGPECAKKLKYHDVEFNKNLEKIISNNNHNFDKVRDFYLNNAEFIKKDKRYLLLFKNPLFKDKNIIIESARKLDIYWYNPFLLEIMIINKMYDNGHNWISESIIENYVNSINKNYDLYFSPEILKKYILDRKDGIKDYCLKYIPEEKIYIIPALVEMENCIHRFLYKKSEIRYAEISYSKISKKNINFLIKKGDFTGKKSDFLESYADIKNFKEYEERYNSDNTYKSLFVLTHEQIKLIETLEKSDLAIINSGGGTGKTELSMFLEYYYYKKYNILRLCPTNKAKSVIIGKRSIKKYKTTDITTQKFLYNFSFEDEKGNKNENKKHENILFIIDEMSMIDLKMMYEFINILNKEYTGKNKFLFIGDSNQLKPVDFGKSVDILNRFMNNKITLTLPQRFGSKLEYLEKITEIINFRLDDLKKFIPDYTRKDAVLRVSQFNEKNFEEEILKIYNTYEPQVQFVTYTNETRKKINQIIKKHKTGNPTKFEKDDYIIFTENKNKDLYNGLCAKITNFGCKNDTLLISYKKALGYDKITCRNEYSEEIFTNEISEMEHAYCITVHNSQGSEYQNVCFVIDKSNELESDLAYTAMSRHRHALHVLSHVKNFEKNIIINKKPDFSNPFLTDRCPDSIEITHIHFVNVNKFNPIFDEFENFCKKNEIDKFIKKKEFKAVGGIFKKCFEISNLILKEKYDLLDKYYRQKNHEVMKWVSGSCEVGCKYR